MSDDDRVVFGIVLAIIYAEARAARRAAEIAAVAAAKVGGFDLLSVSDWKNLAAQSIASRILGKVL